MEEKSKFTIEEIYKVLKEKYDPEIESKVRKNYLKN